MIKKALLTLLTIPLLTQASTTSVVELELKQLFVIQNGFDSNDDVEVTYHTTLPSACYKVHETKVKKLDHQSYLIKAYAKKKELTGCEVGLMNNPINITQTVSLGELAAGVYTFTYNTAMGDQAKYMKIKSSINQTIDDEIYAPISNAFIPELIYPTQNAQVVLTGIFHNTCMGLSAHNIKILRQGNIFVIIPKTKFRSQTNCRNKQVPIREIVNLGPLQDPGPYLIHVRSMSGLSVNKVFYVNNSGQIHRGSL